MKNRFLTSIFFVPLVIIFLCSNANVSYAQADTKNALEVKSGFLGRWKDVQDPNHILEIYKEGDLTIVYRRSEKNDGSESKKYTVISEKGNRIMIDYNYGSTALTLSDDGTKISFAGQEYVKP